MKLFSKTHLAILSLSALLLVSGCSSVTTKHPLTKNPTRIDAEKFEGAWLIEDSVAEVRYPGKQNGVAQIAVLEWKSNQFHTIHGELFVTEGDEHNFVSVRFEEKGKWQDEYAFFAYKFSDDDDLILWNPDVDLFDEAIENKKLGGTVKREKYSAHVSLTNSPKKVLGFLNDPKNGHLFDYKDPLVIRKVRGKD